jgi:hypothetical protein
VPHVARRERVGELALHLLGGDGIEAAQHGVLDLAGHLGAAAGVPGAAGEVLLEAVDAAAEEVLAAVGARRPGNKLIPPLPDAKYIPRKNQPI